MAAGPSSLSLFSYRPHCRADHPTGANRPLEKAKGGNGDVVTRSQLRGVFAASHGSEEGSHDCADHRAPAEYAVFRDEHRFRAHMRRKVAQNPPPPSIATSVLRAPAPADAGSADNGGSVEGDDMLTSMQ
jgi:hypothetical protein